MPAPQTGKGDSAMDFLETGGGGAGGAAGSGAGAGKDSETGQLLADLG